MWIYRAGKSELTNTDFGFGSRREYHSHDVMLTHAGTFHAEFMTVYRRGKSVIGRIMQSIFAQITLEIMSAHLLSNKIMKKRIIDQENKIK